MKSVKINHELSEGIIPSAKMIKLFKIIGLLKTAGSFKIICGFILFIFYISFFYINPAQSSASMLLSLKEWRLNEEFPLLLQPRLAVRASTKSRGFKLASIEDGLFPHFFKVDPLKAKKNKGKNMDQTKWEWIRAFKLEQEEGSSLFFLMVVKEKIFKGVEASNGGQEEARKNKTKGEEIIKPEFKNIKEKISVYAFLAWLWLVIGVLLYILNEQIKEAEKRRQLGL